jgi:hypothetical protein
LEKTYLHFSAGHREVATRSIPDGHQVFAIGRWDVLIAFYKRDSRIDWVDGTPLLGWKTMFADFLVWQSRSW